MNDKYTNDGLRIIKTARTKEAINEAAKKGYWPLVKPGIPNPEIRTKFAVIQDTETREIDVITDFRGSSPFSGRPTQRVINFKFYYPYHFENPYAAYLIPKDIKEGEKVFIEDLIEDVVGLSWNQGDRNRLVAREAIWHNVEFNLVIANEMQVIG